MTTAQFLTKIEQYKKIKKNSRVGGIFRVDQVTPIQLLFLYSLIFKLLQKSTMILETLDK